MLKDYQSVFEFLCENENKTGVTLFQLSDEGEMLIIKRPHLTRKMWRAAHIGNWACKTQSITDDVRSRLYINNILVSESIILAQQTAKSFSVYNAHDEFVCTATSEYAADYLAYINGGYFI